MIFKCLLIKKILTKYSRECNPRICGHVYPDNHITQVLFSLQQSERWRKLRNIVQWTPFFQTYKKQRYPWVQLAGHQGNFKAGPDQGTILKKLSPQEERCFKVI